MQQKMIHSPRKRRMAPSSLYARPLTSTIPTPPRAGLVASIFEWAEALVIALAVGLTLFTFVLRVNTVDGPSMEPTFLTGQKVVSFCLDRNFHYGDVVVVDNHQKGPTQYPILIKRVIATEGQVVDIDSATGTVLVDGVTLDESAYIKNGITQMQDIYFPQTVPAGCLFIMGDNRPVSEDSRSTEVGMVDARTVIGKVWFRLNPFSKVN